MAKLNTYHDIVLGVLDAHPDARGDDWFLYYCVLEKIGFNMHRPFCETILLHAEYKLPSYESITRCRRKIQGEHPELCDDKAKRIRSAEETQYKEYARK